MDSGTKKVLVVAVIAAIFTAVAVAMVYQGQVNTLQAQKQALQQQAAQVPVSAVDLDYSTESLTLNMSANVSSDGSTTAADVYQAVTIENKGDRTANFVISAYDTVNEEEGFDNALENSYFNVYTGDAMVTYLIEDGDYTTGKTISLPTDTQVTLKIGVDLEKAPSGTFEDNQTYSNEVYIIQPDAQDVDELDVNVVT